MIKTVAIVSLSAGTIGEDFVKHEVNIGLKRLEQFGLNVKIMPHAMKGIEYVKNHPKERANDLLAAICDEEVDMILCAIGGDDTYRLLPYLFKNNELKEAIEKAEKRKIFLGFSDTTMNHLMLHKLGFGTFYGQSFLADVCEMEDDMLPYTKKFFEELIKTGNIKEIVPSDVWYEERTDWSESAVGTERTKHENEGFQLLQGKPVFAGKILGGCLESMYDIFDNSRYPDTISLCEKYNLFPSLEDWRGKILLLETSEEQPDPKHYRKMVETLKKVGVFDVVSGVICGKPMNELYFDEYKKIIVDVIDNPNISVVANINIGLQEAKVFDLKLDKTVNRITIQNSKGTVAKEYDNATLAKAEIDAKLVNATTVVVEYTIKVTNEGEVDAYVRKIADYLSSDYKFSSELNKDWYQADGNVYTTSFANQKIAPGESKEIKLIVTKQMTESNTGLIPNTAEIVESYNELGLQDVDSTAGNKVKDEDDMGTAEVILSIKTGEVITTITLIITTVAILLAGSYLISRKIIHGRIL